MKDESGSYIRVCDMSVSSTNGLITREVKLPDNIQINTDKIKILNHTITGASGFD